MKILTSSEVEELEDHLSSRPDIWYKHHDTWVRKLAPEQYALALRVRGVEDGLYVLTTKCVLWSVTSVEEYVLWLLEKYTAYVQRQQVITLLQKQVKSSVNVDALSRDICELRGGTFRQKYLRYPCIIQEEKVDA